MTLKEQTEIFAKNLKKYLEEKNLKQKEVAEAIGVSSQTFNYWVHSDLPVSEKELNIPF